MFIKESSYPYTRPDEENTRETHIMGCNNCGEEGTLHMDTCSIYARSGDEDATLITAKTETNKPDMTVCSIKDGDISIPSLRRDGVRMHFWCETCDHDTFLEVAQHKGTTFVTQVSSRS